MTDDVQSRSPSVSVQQSGEARLEGELSSTLSVWRPRKSEVGSRPAR